MSLALIIAGVALWSLLGGAAFTQEQVLIFQDTFEVSETETTDLGFENDERQSGALGATTYSDSSEDLTVINSEWAPGKLSLFPEPGSEWVAVSPDHNFAFGSPFTIEFEVDAGVDDEDNASGDWAAVVFGATSKNSWVISADGFGILFRNNGDIQVFDAGASIYGGNGGFADGIPKDDLEVRIEVEVDSFDGTSPATIRMFINEEATVITADGATEYVKATGFRANLITMLGGAFGGNAWQHTFDNLKVSAAPAIGVSPTQINAIAGEITDEITVSVPKSLIQGGVVEVTAESLTPGIVGIEGAGDNGKLVLSFADASQTDGKFNLNALGGGVGRVQLSSDQAGFQAKTITVLAASGFGVEEVVFSDTFDTSSEDWDVNFENDGGRQAGTAGILDYVEAEASAAGGAADEFTIVNPDWAEGKLYISGQNVSPDYNFMDGPKFEISFKVHPGSNNDFYDSPDWAAVVFGATEKNKFVNASDGFGILFRNDGRVQVFDGTVAIYGSPEIGTLPEGELDVRITSSSINFAGAPATIRMWINGEESPLTGSSMEYTKQGGFHANNISLLGYGTDLEHTFDDFKVVADACVSATLVNADLGPGEDATQITVKVPVGLIENEGAVVTLSSSNPSVAIPDDNADGTIKLTFAKGGPNTKTVNVAVLGSGQTAFALSVDSGVCIGDPVFLTKRSAFVTNPSFEAHPPAAAWPHYGPVEAWPGASGVNIGGPFNDNGITPDRNQVGFAQGSRAVTQTITGLNPEKQYWLQFHYNRRACCGDSTIDLIVEIDGEEFARHESVKVVGNAGYHSKTVVFTPESDTATVVLRGEAAGDATMIYDAVSIVQRDKGNVIVMNPSFEASGTPPWPGYIQPKLIAGWVGTGNYGVNFNGPGPFANNGKAEDQDLVAFLQGGSSLSQMISGLVPGEKYEVRFACNARGGNSPTLVVKVDDQVLLEESIAAVGGANPFHVKTVRFTASASAVNLSFAQAAAGDNTVILDNIMVTGSSSTLPCITSSVAELQLTVGQTGTAVALTIPEELIAEEDAVLTVTSSDPSVVNITGATDGKLELKFVSDDGELTQSFEVEAIGRGSAALVFSNAYGVCFNPAGVEVNVSGSLIQNPSFEDHPPSASWPHYGPVGGWEGGSGVNNADGPFQDNGVIPDRIQVAFTQGSRKLKQLVGGLEAGQQYWLQFHYNVRNCCGGTMDLSIQFDEEELDYISEISAVGVDEPYYYHHVEFAPESSSGQLVFEAIAAGDATLLLDGVTLVKRTVDNVAIVNPGFEASGTPAWPGYIQPTSIAGWVATGGYGVNVSGPGPFANNGINPEQDRVAFLQGNATLTQTVWELEDGEAYHLSFAFNARGGNKPTLNVTVNGETALEYEVNPVGDAEPYYVYVYNFTADSDEAEITFAQTAEGDNTLLIDDVRLVKGKGTEVELPGPEEPAEPIAMALGQGADTSLTLSWAADQSGWVVQYAENVTGPWKDAGAEATVEDGKLVVKVTPAKTGARFYRLVHP
ncbi:MAG: DUF642 domain-containing protein [Pedosphaera sp.]|nr:DUF642 domain-containing protein [Pedosphaera sp.]